MSYTMGVDIGSVSSKCVILKDGREIAAAVTIGAGTGTSGPQKAVEAALGAAGLEMADILYTVATGYGRATYEAADEEKSEIACHAPGAYFQIPGVQTLIDIGGQDAKAVKIGSDGRVLDFVMNEKMCRRYRQVSGSNGPGPGLPGASFAGHGCRGQRAS